MATPLKIKSPAKINLALDILGKSSKYHKIQTIYQEISLHDTIAIREIAKNKIIIKSNDKTMPLTKQNLAYQAAEIMKKRTRKKIGLEIFIDKHIPVASGFAGGSSNAAAVLKGLNEMWKMRLSRGKLENLAANIGMDTPFFMTGGTAVGTHFGEKIRTTNPCPKLPLLLLIPTKKNPIIAKTKSVYKKINLKFTGKNQKSTKLLCRAIKNKNRKELLANLHNDIETAVDITATKAILKDFGASAVILAGSGPGIIAFLENKLLRKKCVKSLDKKFKKQFKLILAST
ncbi:4-(cytidine 5'-diphospho)-2-C-methyl-D-erythritol kinase [Candidatus Peregrinibacteria bacterium]|nr:4-(cytidine 5'-diphospho)-2-C-methyl-D-erythritol kinase [Candidatus Peregrinibacteria bacterium]